MIKHKVLVSSLLLFMSACASKTTLNLNESTDGLRVFRASEEKQSMTATLTAIGDIEHSYSSFSEDKATEENLNYVRLEAKKMGATVLVINKADSKYNIFSAKHTVTISATAYK